MTTRLLVKSICVSAALATLLSACGRKGPLDTPRVTATPASVASETLTDDDDAAPATVPNQRRFILDGLLE
ncbi:lipoprotein [Hoeflea sp. G2-23]|uniref:Lipoprotein n=1 Tax=Hoeflea algicola TaxID=2983763 RepID=A0ABT3ZA72_9HYPH|nr:lipoprotein [Hoeflea algicola]MCY0148695.1 lipoprotein [Hoeflea algicola]